MLHFVSTERLSQLLARARATRICVVGDAMLDVYLHGDVERISPEAPVPVVRVRERKWSLGGAANVAQNIAAIGARCDLVAAVGHDAGGERIRTLLRELGAGDDSVVTLDRQTTQKTRILARAQQLVRIDEEQDDDLTSDESARVVAALDASVDAADALVLEDYNKGILTADVIARAVRRARARGIPVVVDPKFRNFFAYAGATVFKPNLRELESALGAVGDAAEPARVQEMLGRLGVEHILLTMGEHGMALYSRDGAELRIPTVAREVYDVVGAGDTVTAYLATMIAGGASVAEAAIIANIAAGIEVGKLGADTVSPDELLDYVATHPALAGD